MTRRLLFELRVEPPADPAAWDLLAALDLLAAANARVVRLKLDGNDPKIQAAANTVSVVSNEFGPQSAES